MPEPTILTPELVNATFADCVAPKRRHLVRVRVTVGRTTVSFDKAKLTEHAPTVLLMLSELPSEFRTKGQGGEGGWTIRNACKTKHGSQWTKLMVEVERLLALGVASGWVKTRDVGKMFPGYDIYATLNLPIPAGFADA